MSISYACITSLWYVAGSAEVEVDRLDSLLQGLHTTFQEVEPPLILSVSVSASRSRLTNSYTLSSLSKYAAYLS